MSNYFVCLLLYNCAMSDQPENHDVVEENQRLKRHIAALVAIIAESLAIAEREGHYSHAQQLRQIIKDSGVTLS